MRSSPAGNISVQTVAALPADAQREDSDLPLNQRLHEETGNLFSISFDLNQPLEPLLRLDFAFDRNMLLKSIEEGMGIIKRSILLFVSVGVISILIALFFTAYAMHTTRQLESHFQEIYHRASQAETAAQLVHDLRNHLAALRANIKALLVAPQQRQEIVADMDSEIVHLNDKLSTFLSATSPRDEAFEPVDISALIDESIRLAEPVLHEHGLGVETALPSALPQPVWQKAAMRDALLNLLINAAQSGQREGFVRVAVDMEDKWVSISVEDRGNGIDRRDLPHIFEAFYTTRDQGHGLGLAIVQRIVQAHQGWVHAENRPGGGTRIVIVLPQQRMETPQWWMKFKKNSPI